MMPTSWPVTRCRSHYWTTNEFEHDGVHGSVVFEHIFNEALNRGDLQELF